MKEIQGKSILVRVSSRFDLARVRVIGRQLYLEGHGLFRTFLDISQKKKIKFGILLWFYYLYEFTRMFFL